MDGITNYTHSADWPALLELAARELLAEPNHRLSRANELRYGTHGSLSVNLEGGVWFDHEAGEGGGVLNLVMREHRCDKREALRWLATRFPDRFDLDRRRIRRAVPRQGFSSGPSRGSTPCTRRIVDAMWEASIGADGTPGHAYLERRQVWSPVGADLPCTVRWLPAGSTLPRDPRATWHGLPRGVAGCLVFAWLRLRETGPCAVSLIAISREGERVLWHDAGSKVWCVGRRRGSVFVARAGDETQTEHVAEGELDALALAAVMAPSAHRVVAAGGTAGLRTAARLTRGPCVVLHADGGPGGRIACAQAQAGILAQGRRALIRWYADGSDPAQELAEAVGERAAIREVDGDELRSVAERAAWDDVVRSVRGQAT